MIHHRSFGTPSGRTGQNAAVKWSFPGKFPCGISGFHRHHCRRVSAASAFSAEALEAIKHARERAQSHCSMFVVPDHLFVGILSTPCEATKLLNSVALEEAQASSLLDASAIIVTKAGGATPSQLLKLSDIELAPDTKAILMGAQQCSAGSECIGTSHLMRMLLAGSGLASSMLAKLQVDSRALEDRLDEISLQHPEQAVHIISAQEQVAKLKQQYELMKHDTEARGPHAQMSAQSAEDDIYN